MEPVSILKLFTQEVFGGIGLGLILGWIAFKMMKSIDNYEIEVIITIAIVMGGTLIAHKWHLSSPLAMVSAGLLVGNDKLRQAAMSKETEGYVDKFWELIDVLFNIILFVLIGMEILVLTFRLDYILAGLIAVPFILTVPLLPGLKLVFEVTKNTPPLISVLAPVIAVLLVTLIVLP